MKDKRTLLKLASILQIVFSIYKICYAFYENKNENTIIATIFLEIIGIIFAGILYKKSKEDINKLKSNKIIISLCSIWMFIDNIIPGVLGFIFLSKISDHKKSIMPENNIEVTNTDKIKSIILIILFLVFMYIVPLLPIYKENLSFIMYFILFLLVIIFNFKRLKNDFLIFISNKKVNIKFIFKRYFIMFLLLIIVSIPIIYIGGGKQSNNQQLLNIIFKKMPLVTFLLSTVYAPIVEENIFRLSLGNLINNKKIFVIFSGILFGLLHVIGKINNIQDMIYILQYSTLGICLAKAYYDSKNIFSSIGMHFLQNFIAAILVLLFI